MDLEWKKMIESNVYDYISKIDYNNPDFNINEFKVELGKIIGMEPAVKIKWNTIEKINELKKDAGVSDFKQIIDKAEGIHITFVDENQKPIVLKFLI